MDLAVLYAAIGCLFGLLIRRLEIDIQTEREDKARLRDDTKEAIAAFNRGLDAQERRIEEWRQFALNEWNGRSHGGNPSPPSGD